MHTTTADAGWRMLQVIKTLLPMRLCRHNSPRLPPANSAWRERHQATHSMARPPKPASIWDPSSSPSSSSPAAAPLPRLLPPPRPRPLPLAPFPPRPPLLPDAFELPALALLPLLVPALVVSLSLPPSPLAAAAALAVVPWSAAEGQHSSSCQQWRHDPDDERDEGVWLPIPCTVVACEGGVLHPLPSAVHSQLP
jgi:hypothetical protein